MGYALLFARSLANTAKKNRLNYETMSIQHRKTEITNSLANIQKAEEAMKKNEEKTPQNGGEIPNVVYLQMYKDCLTLIDKNLDSRLACIKTQLAQIASEEQGVNDALASAISASTPKYAGM